MRLKHLTDRSISHEWTSLAYVSSIPYKRLGQYKRIRNERLPVNEQVRHPVAGYAVNLSPPFADSLSYLRSSPMVCIRSMSMVAQSLISSSVILLGFSFALLMIP